MNRRREDALKRADAATRFARGVEFVAAVILLFLAFYGIGYMALIGDEIQQARIQADRERAVEAMGL